MNKRVAVLVGCNYPNTPNELHGCINDVVSMREVLINRFGFEPRNIEVLTDAEGSVVMPTGANIKSALARMVDGAEPGDVLFFHYSGHGTQIPSIKHGHFCRQDEAIVPCDFNLITDVDFRELVNRVPKGASFTIISDSCHSGGLIDKEKEQIGPNSSDIATATPTITTASDPYDHQKPKTIPFPSILNHLSSLTNINTPDIGTHLLEVFGDDSSLRFRSSKLELDSIQHNDNDDDGILLSGCQANETSADMRPMNGGGKAYGAFSNAIQTVLLSNKEKHYSPITNKDLVTMARRVLEEQHLHQHPCLYCSDDNANKPFLWEPLKP